MTEEHLFEHALGLPEAERGEFLERECPDPALKARILALLAADAQSHSPLDALATHTQTSGDPAATGSFRPGPSPEEAEGVVIAGRYKLRQQIGEGGMGTVWMADQTEPIKRKVAVKLIRVERGQSKAILARFEAERQAIALMDHPHMAKLLDAGTTEHGSPFFVMELVKGIPLNDFCDQHRLTVPERLKLFMQICSAVQHAHQKGIIHRDLKPGNVLVESHDGKPVPKVIDFGLAKATTGLQLSEQSLHTAFGSVLGTPLYMAPEQASFNALDVDTRADVYALGVILYELLTGTTPITRETLKKAAFYEMLRIIREEDAPTPSCRISTSEGTPSAAAVRGMEPKKLSRFVKGELDWIVMKALSKDRDRRYETANGFAKDIERFLNHEPVLAGPPTPGYRLRKFIRRHRSPVIAASLVLLALVAGVIGTTIGFVHASRAAEQERLAKVEAELRRQEAEAATEKERLAKEAETRERKYAEAIAAFVKDDFLALTSIEGQGRFGGAGLDRNSTLLDLLHRGAAKLRERKDMDPRIDAELSWIIGVNYRGAGEAAKGVPFLERAVALRRQVLGAEHGDTLNAMNSLAVCYHAAGQLAQALPLMEETLRLMKAKLGADHPDTLVSMNNLATGYRAAGQLAQALPLMEETLKLRKAKLGADHPDTLASMNNLAMGYQAAGQLDQALPLMEETLRLMKAKLGADHPDTLASMNNLAMGYQVAGQLAQALPLMEETLKLKKAKLGADHPDTLASMNNLAAGYRAAGQLDQALPLLEETLKRMKAKLGADHPDTLASMNNLAKGYQAAGQLAKALPLYEETLKLQKAKLGADHPDTLASMNNLAECYRATGQLAQALPLYEETLKRMKAKLGADHPDTLTSMGNLAAGYWSLKQLDKSVPLFEQLLPLQEKKLGRNHSNTLHTVANLGVNYKDAGRLTEALPLLEEAYGASKRLPNLRWVGQQLLDGYTKADKKSEATKLVGELLADERKTLPKDSPQLAGLMARFGLSLLELRAFDDAEPLLRECLSIREKKEPEAWTTFNTLSMLGGALLGQKKYADAEPLLVKGYEGMKAHEKAIPQGATRLPEALDRLIDLHTATNQPEEVKKYQDLRAKYPAPKEKK
jgi:serine/threonine protein kinase